MIIGLERHLPENNRRTIFSRTKYLLTEKRDACHVFFALKTHFHENYSSHGNVTYMDRKLRHLAFFLI